LIDPSAVIMAPRTRRGVKKRPVCRLCIEIISIVGRRMAGGALAPCRKKQLRPAPLRRVAFLGSSVPSTFNFGAGRKVEQFLHLRHRLHLAAAVEDVHGPSLPRSPCRHRNRPPRWLEFVKSSDGFSSRAANRIVAGCSLHAGSACRSGAGTTADGHRRRDAWRRVGVALEWQSKQATRAGSAGGAAVFRGIETAAGGKGGEQEPQASSCLDSGCR